MLQYCCWVTEETQNTVRTAVRIDRYSPGIPRVGQQVPLRILATGDPETAGDPSWQPFINTPNYSDYTSRANNVTGAVTRMLALYFGTDHMTFSVATTNPAASEPTRTYHHFSDAAADVVNARVYEGIHFRPADFQGRKQGRHVARWSSLIFCGRSMLTMMMMTTRIDPAI